MAKLSKRTTVYFEPGLHQELKTIAASSSISVSKLVDQAVRLLIEGEREIVEARSHEQRPGNLEAVQKFAAHADSPYKPDIPQPEDAERNEPSLPEVEPERPTPGEAANSYGAMLRNLRKH